MSTRTGGGGAGLPPSPATAHRLVAGLGQERRRLAGAEHGEIDGTRGGPIDRAHLEPADTQRVVGAGEEVQILARRIEGRRGGIREAVGDLVRALRRRSSRGRSRAGDCRGSSSTRSTASRATTPRRSAGPGHRRCRCRASPRRRWRRRSPTVPGGCPRAAAACRRVTTTGAEKNAFDGNAIARGLVTPVCSAIIS